MRDAFREGPLDPCIVETLIVLIPKEPNPTKFTQFRPISLCNVIYKIITKELVNHMRAFLMDFISPLQSNFILGRRTHDSILFP